MTRTRVLRVLRRIGGTVTAAVAIGGAVGAVADVSGRSHDRAVPVNSPSPQHSPSAPHPSHAPGTGAPRATGTTPTPGVTHRPTHRATPAPTATP